jgi:hypothetical protein
VKPGDKEPVTPLHSEALPTLDLTGKIHTLRGLHVMLDKDLAELYGIKPRRLREQVKRNPGRFPDDFMFQLGENDVKIMVSQNAIPSRSHLGGTLPYAFTEQGVASLSGVLTGTTAEEVYVRIMRAFVAMRCALHIQAGMFQRLDGMERRQIAFEAETERRFDRVFDALEKPETLPRQGIFYDGQMFDAHAFASRLIRSAGKSILLIDNYVDETVLTLLAKRTRGIPATIYTRNVTAQLHLDVDKHNAQYPTLEVREFRDSHDRFLILDGETVYHLGASLKDLGKKWFAFSRFERGAAGMLDRLGIG